MGIVRHRDRQGSAGLTVQSMNNPGTQQSPAGSETIQIALQGVAERGTLDVSHRVANHSGGFVDDNQPGISVDDRNLDRFRIQQLVRRFEQSDFNALSRVDPMVECHAATVDQHPPGPNDALHPPRRVIPQMFDEKGIDANAPERWRDREFQS